MYYLHRAGEITQEGYLVTSRILVKAKIEVIFTGFALESCLAKLLPDAEFLNPYAQNALASIISTWFFKKKKKNICWTWLKTVT